jgi:hypothetical protein
MVKPAESLGDPRNYESQGQVVATTRHDIEVDGTLRTTRTFRQTRWNNDDGQDHGEIQNLFHGRSWREGTAESVRELSAIGDPALSRITVQF